MDPIPSLSNDPVENEKDFAPPPTKKLKVDKDGLVVAEEEHNTDSGRGEEHNIIDSWTRPSDEEIFEIWKEHFSVSYPNTEEEEKKFNNFKKSLNGPPGPLEQYFDNCIACADLTREEVTEMFHRPYPVYNYLDESDIKLLIKVVEDCRRFQSKSV